MTNYLYCNGRPYAQNISGIWYPIGVPDWDLIPFEFWNIQDQVWEDS